MFSLRTIFCVCFSLLVGQGFSQVSFESEAELQAAADKFFNESDYTKAKPLFSQLLSKNPLDPNFNYRFGVCIMYTEADPLKPMPYIEGGSNSSGVNPEAHFFLGRIYQLNYRFDQAITAFEKAKKAGYAGPLADLDKSIEECRNGKILYNSAVEFNPDQDKEVLASEFYRPYDFRKLKGKVIPMPPTFKTKYDEKNLIGTVVYTPLNSTTLVYASYGESGANAKDLYQVNRLPNGEWAIPQQLPPNVNTKYDEDYAFYDEESNTLFFSSRGHNSMGGFDVFSSKFDANTGNWSTPVNLQYPINSPFDDFLYVRDPDGTVAFFTSSRNTAEGKLRVFKTDLIDTEKVELSVVGGTYIDRTDSVFNYMTATVSDPKSKEVVGTYKSHKETGKYVLILPAANDYVLNVGPREADGFKFDLDVPVSDSYKTLGQQIDYAVIADKGEVKLTNFFDATGNVDTVSLVASKPLNELNERMVAMPDPSAILAQRAALENVEAEKIALAEAAKRSELEAARKKAEAEQLARAEAAKKAELEAAREKAETERLAAELQAKIELEKARESELAAQAEELKKQAIIEEEKELAQQKENLLRKQEEELKAAEAKAHALASEKAKMAADRKQAELLALEKERADALKQAELADQVQAEKIVQEKAKEDSLLALNEEKEQELEFVETDELQSEVGSDPIASELESNTVSEDETPPVTSLSEDEALAQILKEMKETEEELLKARAEVASANAGQSATTKEEELLNELEEVDSEPVENVESLVEVPEEPSSDSVLIETTEESELASGQESTDISDDELFLQTIAEIEAQNQDQEALIAAENEQVTLSKNPKPVPSTEKPKSDADSDLALEIDAEAKNEVTDSAQESASPSSTESPTVLKSNAKPEEYLAALNEIEQTLAEDAKQRPEKKYELTELNPEPVSGKSKVDPVLQATIDADRSALEAHQKIAIQKEEALALQLQADQQVLSGIDADLASELEAVNEDLVPAEDKPEMANKQPEFVEPPLHEEPITEEAQILVNEVEEEVAILEETIEDDLLLELAQVDEAAIEEVEVANQEAPNSAELQVENTESELVPAPESEPELQAELVVPETEVELVETEPTTAPDPSIELPSEEVKFVAPQPREVTVGTIPFLTAQKRFSSTEKPSFDAIEDKSLVRMIKRMRSEDIGRMAVIKNIRNERIDAAGDEKKLAEIRSNPRNQEVLATIDAQPAREEIVRPPFNRDHLRKRDGVSYKLELRLTSANVSNTVIEAMNPEAEMYFSMPDFNIQTGYFDTYAEATSGFNEYKHRGLGPVKIIPYLNGVPAALSMVEEIPFID